MIESLVKTVYSRLKADIVSAVLRPGTLYSENELTLGLGVSRTTVHGAILRLEEEGFVFTKLKSGFEIKDISFDEFFDMQETIVALELYALSMANAGRARIDAEALAAQLSLQTQAQASCDIIGYYRGSLGFAAVILSASHNESMQSILAAYGEKLMCKVVNYRLQHPETRPSLTRNRNQRIYSAILNSKFDLAQAELSQSLADIWDILHMPPLDLSKA